MKINSKIRSIITKIGLIHSFLLIAIIGHSQAYEDGWSFSTVIECSGIIKVNYVIYNDYSNISLYDPTFDYNVGVDYYFGVDLQVQLGDNTAWITLSRYRLVPFNGTNPGPSYTNYSTVLSGAMPWYIFYENVPVEGISTQTYPIDFDLTGNIPGESIQLVTTLANLQNYIGQNIQFRLHNGTWSEGGVTPTFENVTIPAQIALSSFTASNNTFCDGINLEWTQPLGICPESIVVIERNDGMGGSDFTEVAQVPFATSPYTDYTALPGVEYFYRGRLANQIYTPGPASISFNNGPLSANVTGMRKAPQAPPPGFAVSTSSCTDEVALNWQFINGTDSIEIFRDGVSVGLIAGNQTSFSDPVPESDTGFSYTIRAKNNCGWGEQSAALIGASPGLPIGSANLTATVIPGSGISLNWEPVNNVSGYKIERTQLGGGGATVFEVDNSTTTYLDESLVACQTYEYRVRSVNSCSSNGVASDTVRTASLIPNLLTTFAEDALTGSKGYFPNRVEVSWSTQNNGNQINAYKIYRKQLGSDEDSLQITSVNSGNNLYIDNFADAGVLYKYTIVGETQCESTTLYSNPAESVGFRRPFGTVNGNVTYSGGIAVEGVRITAETTSQIFGKSALLTGSESISIEDKPSLNPGSEFLLEAWVRPTQLTGTDVFFQKGNAYRAQYDAATASIEFTVTASDGQQYTLTQAAPQFLANNYNHLAFQLYQDSLQLFLNGGMLASEYTAAGISVETNPSPVVLGFGFQGQLDEVRIWNTGKDSLNMARDYSRLMLGGEPGLMAYLRMDEGAGKYAYDVSRNGNIFNRNHGSFSGNISFSTIIPTTNQLGIAAYSNAQGNYTLLVPYNGVGESFVLTPSYLTHQFNPSTRAIYIGDGSSVYNNIDFLDISSFTVSGTVFYDSTSCPAANVGLYVDGTPILADGQPVMTGTDGAFEIQVPIGLHHVTVEKQDHVFSVGRFPETGKYNFQDDKVIGEFEDATLITVVGRVVGGLREANKVPALGRSRNNIGTAILNFTSLAGNGCATGVVSTDSLSGEYRVQLPPLSYVPSVSIPSSDPPITFGDASLLDLTNSTAVTTVYDTLYNSLGDPYQVDSARFNRRLDYIYRVNPIIDVKAIDGVSPFIGDTVFTYEDEATNTVITRNLITDPMRWPVFANDADGYAYRCMIWIYEPYFNNDSGIPQLDKVPTSDGQLIVTNDLAAKQNQSLNLADLNEPDSLVAIVYSFPLGAPSFVENLTYPDYSYARRFEMTLLTADNQTIDWNPGTAFSTYGDGKYHGYVLAGINVGNQFVTEGPQVPEYVLRDPPGSNSFASREVGTTRTTENQWSWSENKWGRAEDKIYLGASISTGMGVSINIEAEANLAFGLEASQIGGRSGIVHTTVTNTMEWKTNAGTDMPGAGSDLYVGKTQNVEFGVAQHLAIVPDTICDDLECLKIFGNGFALAKKYGLSVKDGGYATTFIYSQSHILNYEIPSLTNLRNIALQSDERYSSTLELDDPNYGRNNDDPVFGDQVSTVTPNHGEYADFTGPSYTYTPITTQDSIRDIVRFTNNQIKQWQDAIKLNEWEKINIKNTQAIDSLETLELARLTMKYTGVIVAYNLYISQHDTSGSEMYSKATASLPGAAVLGITSFSKTSESNLEFSLILEDYYTYLQAKDRIINRFASVSPANFSISGGNELTSSVTQFVGHSTTSSQDFGMTEEAIFEFRSTVSNIGLGFTSNIGTTVQTGRDWTAAADSSETVSFTLFDPDQGDQMSVSVYPSILGWGPIFFKEDGGRSACPYEPQILTQFYHPGSAISGTSLQVDKPAIAVSPAIITNTPVDEPAVFNLTLINESETNDTRNYNVQLVSSSNPFGAIVKIDGLSPSTSAIIPGGGAINKVLSVAKGPGPVYDYDSLLIVISAPCQYEAGTSDNMDIADSVYISARFTPACTDVALQAPELQWVANNFNENVVQAILSGYNINYFDLEHLNFQFKPSNESQWITLETFYRDTTGFNDPSKLPIASSSPVTLYNWNIDQLPDGYYDLRLKSQCVLADNTSVIHTGIIDRINPHPFGSPSPADGILSPNDELSIRFNEPIDQGSLSFQNFDIRGVLNGTETAHAASLYFDGVDDYVEVTGGAALTNRDFTIQMAIKPTGSGERALMAQGTDPGEQLYLGLTANNQLVFRINDQEVTSNSTPLANDMWHYIAVAYNYENETAEIFVANELTSGLINNGNTSIFPDYQGSGRLWIGKKGNEDPNWFWGNIHEVRIWDRTLSLSEFTTTMNRILGGGESGLLYNWRMDEVEGNIAIDHVRRRDASIFGPTWSLDPSGSSANFDGTANYLKVQSGDVAITQEMDFTLEFWFRGSGNNPGVLYSNGKADGLGADSLYAWSLRKDPDGLLYLRNDGIDFLLSQNNYFDGQWHHLAVVMNRNANLSAIVDGNPQLSTPATPFKQLSGAAMYIGAHGYYTGTVETVESYFDGGIDEFRFWNTARKQEQIQRDKHNRMRGDEPSLQLYVPFENYQLDPTGVAILTPSFEEQVNSDNHPVESNGATLSDEVPTIKVQRPVEGVAFSWSVNDDEVIFTTTTAPEMIENVTLDITVSGVKDMQGNVMASPATWIAYIDKNQVVWGDDMLSFEKEVGDELNFTSQVVNQGGAAKAFTIQHIPDWLTVNPAEGTIPPNSSLTVDFSVDPLINIGDYVRDIQLLTDFNYSEKLTVDLKVRQTPPTWEIDPSDWAHSMGIIGLLQIKGIVSSDEEDMLAAFVDGELRGAEHLEYIPEIDRYLVFMDIYSNVTSGESLSFKIWDAGSGILYSGVNPAQLVFSANTVVGTVLDPQVFSTSYQIEIPLPFDAGYNWFSQYLLNADSANFDLLFESLTSSLGDQVMGQTQFAGYTPASGWNGPLETSGLRPEKLYKYFSANPDTLIMRGDIIDPTSRLIDLQTGWNWIGYISIRNQDITQALGNLNATEGDQIKGRSQFAVYANAVLGWQGTLQTLVSGQGYMYKSSENTSFTYPLAGMYKSGQAKPSEFSDPRWPVNYAAYPNNMTVIAKPSDSCSVSAFDAGLLLAATDREGILRGIAEIQKVGKDASGYSFLTVAGDVEENLDLHWIDPESGKVWEATGSISYLPNGEAGSINEPLIVSLPEEFCGSNTTAVKDGFSVFPTAFEDHLTILYTAGLDESNAEISLRDITGRELFTVNRAVNEGANHWRIDIPQGRFVAGTYTISLTTETSRSVQKLVRTK